MKLQRQEHEAIEVEDLQRESGGHARHDTTETERMSPQGSDTSPANFAQAAKGLGPYAPWAFAIAFAAASVWQALYGTAQERAEAEYRFKRTDEVIGSLTAEIRALRDEQTKTNEKLSRLTERPLVSERDLMRWSDTIRESNPTVKIPAYRPTD